MLRTVTNYYIKSSSVICTIYSKHSPLFAGRFRCASKELFNIEVAKTLAYEAAKEKQLNYYFNKGN